jgi:hypothetical protein
MHHIQLEQICPRMVWKVQPKFVCLINLIEKYFLRRKLEALVSFHCFLLHLSTLWNVDLLKGFILLPGMAFGSSWKEQWGFGSRMKGFKVNDFKYGWLL